jgi:hypothetical protein
LLTWRAMERSSRVIGTSVDDRAIRSPIALR